MPPLRGFERFFDLKTTGFTRGYQYVALNRAFQILIRMSYEVELSKLPQIFPNLIQSINR
jgi:hypothetical protein